LKIIIVGAGEVGFHIASHLAREKKDVVVIDENPEAVRRVSDHIDVQTLIGSGSSPVMLETAGIREAEILLAVTNRDETNLVACLMANIISPNTRKLARIRGGDFDQYLDQFCAHAPHIDTVINPEVEVVKTIERLMESPDAADVVEFAGGRVRSIGIRMDETNPLAGIRLADLPERIPDRRFLIFSIIRDDQVIVPMGKHRLLPGDLIYFISEKDHVAGVLKHFNKHSEPIRRIMIVGGGRIGTRLARRLKEKNIQIKIIDKSAERCAYLAETLDRVVVLKGDGSDREMLKEENIADMDMFISLTSDEETNILASLLAKRLGARKTITRISKFSYLSLMHTIGIEQVVDPRLSAINTILQHIRIGKVLSAASLRGEQAEVLEAIAMETSDIVGKPLKNLSMPKGVLVTTILRGDRVIIPTGDSVVEPGDRIIIFTQRESIPRLERILSVKLDYF